MLLLAGIAFQSLKGDPDVGAEGIGYLIPVSGLQKARTVPTQKSPVLEMLVLVCIAQKPHTHTK